MRRVVFALCAGLIWSPAFCSSSLQSFSVTSSVATTDVFLSIGTMTTPDGNHTSWPATVNLDLLSSLPSSVNLNFPDRSSVALTKIRSEARGQGSFLWTGHGNGCSALFSAAPVNFRGVISCSNASYGIEVTSSNSTALKLVRLDPSAIAPTNYSDTPALSLARRLNSQTTTPCGTALPTSDTAIEILVLFNESVRTTLDPPAGSTSIANTVKFAHDVVDSLQLAMDDSKSTADTGPIAQVKFLGAQEVTLADTGGVDSELNSILFSTEVSNFRTYYGADSIMYLVEAATQNIGATLEPGVNNGSVPPPGPDYASLAMSVVQRSKALNDTAISNPANQEPYTFMHEFGHQLGANHNSESANNPTPLAPYAFGKWQSHNPTEGGGLRTLLSYRESTCTSPCTRVLRYSNPDALPEDWFNTGSATQDNALVIKTYANTMAQYCASVTRIFADSFDDRFSRP